MANSSEEEPLRSDDESGRRGFLEDSSLQQKEHQCLVALRWISLPLLLTLSMVILLIPMEQFSGTDNNNNSASQNGQLHSQKNPNSSVTAPVFPPPQRHNPEPPSKPTTESETGSENEPPPNADNYSETDEENGESEEKKEKNTGDNYDSQDDSDDTNESGTDSDNDSGNNSENDSENDSENNSENDSGNDSENDSENNSENDSENDSGNDSENDSGNDSENDSENNSENDSGNDSNSESDPEAEGKGEAKNPPGKEEVEWKHAFRQLNGLNISYYETVEAPNATKPKLVFLHGIVTSAAVLIPVFKNLAKDFHILLPDSRGHGDSQPIPPNSFTMMKLISDALQMVKLFHDEDNDEPIFLIGHNMGASTAASIAQYFPTHIKALVLEEPPWSHSANVPMGGSNRPLPPFFARSRTLKKLTDEAFARLNAVGGKTDPLSWTHLEALRAFDADEIEPTYWTAEHLISQEAGIIKMPVMLQTAKENSLCAPEIVEKMLRLWPKGKEVVFDDVNAKGGLHAFHFTLKEEWLKSVQDFFKENS